MTENKSVSVLELTQKDPTQSSWMFLEGKKKQQNKECATTTTQLPSNKNKNGDQPEEKDRRPIS